MGRWGRLPKWLWAVTVGYKMPLKLVLVVRETMAGRGLGAWQGGRGLQCIPPPSFLDIPWRPESPSQTLLDHCNVS